MAMIVLTTLCSFGSTGPRNAIVSLDPQTRRSISDISDLDRSKWIGGHWGTGANGWSPSDLDLFGESGYRAHPGRSFVFSGRMSTAKQDSNRPGFVDRTALLQSCLNNPPKVNWPVADLNFISSSKTTQLYQNKCAGPGGKRPKGFVPGSHQAVAEFFALFYQHCMAPTLRSHYLIEVANECNVKVFANKCNTTWQEMIDLHVAVGDALHQAYAQNRSGSPRPIVCGPTAAYPEYQMHDFQRWRANGTFREFVSATVNAIDCFSVHLYTTADSVPTNDDPFSANMSWRSGNNILATLDLQEVATALFQQRPSAPKLPLRPLPVLISEYGVSFKDNAPAYAPAHDWWILRGVNSKLMTFLDRPDRIIRALPFIVGKATWNKASMSDNSSHSYPFVLWRNVTTPSLDDDTTWTWIPTHLHKFFQAWQHVDGARFVADSSDMNLLVHGFRSQTRITVVLHSLRVAVGEDIRARLVWPTSLDRGRAVNASIRRLYWDTDAQAPVVTDNPQDITGSLPRLITLQPGELAVLTINLGLGTIGSRLSTDLGLPWKTTAAVIETTFYSERFLTALASSSATATPFVFENVPVTTIENVPLRIMRLRFGIGGAIASIQSGLTDLVVHLNGALCAVTPSTQIGGPLRVQHKDGSVFTSIEIPVPHSAVGKVLNDSETASNITVTVWSSHSGGIVISTAVLIVQHHDVSVEYA